MRAVRLPLIALLSTATACGSDGPGPRPELADVDRVVFVGDNSATAPAYATSYARLLVHNDDDLFPEFAGNDLATLLDVDELDLSRGGDSYHAIGQLEAPICACGDPCADSQPCIVDPESDAPSLVIVSLGMNDALDVLIRMFLDNGYRADPTPLLDALRLNVQATFAAIDATFSPRPLLVVVTPYDPSDGVGDLADVASMFYPIINAELLPAEVLQPALAQVLAIIEEEAALAEAIVVDANGHFTGHGYHNDGTDLWLQNLFDVNLRGAHELRRVVWNQLTGESITAPPGGLPTDNPTLPVIPDPAGWANEPGQHAITESFIEPLFEREYVNIDSDPFMAVNSPESDGNDATAIGIAGAWLTLDLGEGEEAVDGPGKDILVLELGGTVSAGAPEPYRLLVSDSPTGPWTILGDGRGERAFDLAPAGVASARFVRIESHAHIPDVMSGFGSPVAPGPEIDAVGAVYPGGAGL